MAPTKVIHFAIKCFIILVISGITAKAMAQHSTPLTMPGNEIFGTIQEVVQKLEADPKTDWSKVDLEALRQHLLDMKAFTEEVDVISKRPITNGVKIEVRPQTKRAVIALKHLFSMHPAMLKMEKGWDMEATQNGDQWTITCTTRESAEVEKIRALGYIRPIDGRRSPPVAPLDDCHGNDENGIEKMD